MEELVILQYSSFNILGTRAKSDAPWTVCSKRVTKWVLQGGLYLDELRRDYSGWSINYHQERGLFLLEGLLHNIAAMQQKERERITQRCPQAQPIEMAKVTAPAHPSVRTLLGSIDREILDIMEQVYGEYVLAPSELPCQQQEKYMTELQQELIQHMARVGLREELAPARPISQS